MNGGVLLSARSELRRRWGSVAMLAVLLCVGGGSTIAAVGGAHRTHTAFPRMLQVTRRATLSVVGATDNGFTDLDPRLLDEVMRISGVRGAAIFAFMAVATVDSPNFFTLALVDSRGLADHPLALEGAPPEELPTLGADEAVVNEAMQQQLGTRTGDTVELESYTPEEWMAGLSGGGPESGESHGPRLTVRVAGVVRSPEDVSDAPDPFFVFPPAFFRRYRETIGNCICDVEITADPARLDEVAADVQKVYPDAYVQRAEDLSSRVADTVSLQRRTWLVIALVAALATVAALFQAGTRMSRLLMNGDTARTALGMTPRERRAARFAVIAPAIVAGSLAAVPAAYLLSPLAPVGLTRLAEPRPGLLWDPVVVVPGAVIALVVGLAVGLAVTAASTARGRATSERLPATGRATHPQIALGNRLAIGPGRGAIAGILLAVAGLVGALTIEHSLRHVLDTPALYGADFDASNFLSGGEDKRSLAEQASADDEVEAAAVTWSQVPSAPWMEVVGPHGSAQAAPRAFEDIKGVISVRQTEGHIPGRPDEAALGQVLLDQIGAKIGDRITVTGTKGSFDLTVVGDDLDPGVDTSGRGLAMTPEGLSTVADAAIDGAVIRFAPGVDRSVALDRYAALHFTAVTPPSEILHIGQLGGLPSRVGQLLTVLGIVALLNAIVLGLRLARRDIALHRALGFTSSQVVRVHLWASAVIASTGVALGGVTGFVVGRAIERQLVDDVGAVAQTIVPVATVAAVAAGTMAVCLGSGLVMSVLALRRRPGAELRAE